MRLFVEDYIVDSGNFPEHYDEKFYAEVDLNLDVEIPKNFKNITVIFKNGGCVIEVTLNKTEWRNDYFTISSFYGNCGLCILSECSSTDKDTWDFAEKLCIEMEYSQVLYSVADHQTAIMKILEGRDYKLLEGSKVINQRSKNEIMIYSKHLEVNQDY